MKPRTHLSSMRYLLLCLLAASALAADINCIEPTPGPAECCTLTVQDAGQGAEYDWFITYGPGTIDPTETWYNWTNFHCIETENGQASIEVDIQQGPWGGGGASCWGGG